MSPQNQDSEARLSPTTVAPSKANHAIPPTFCQARHEPCPDISCWRLWFDYWIPGKGCCLGYAENKGEFGRPGGFQIRHEFAKPLMENWVNPEVIKIDGTYHCFGDPPGYPVKSGIPASGAQWMSRAICESTSNDGIHWKRLGYIPPDQDADACHVPQALVTTIDGHRWLYLFYATQVGCRRNDGQYHYEYDRIRAMRRRIDGGEGAPRPPSKSG